MKTFFKRLLAFAVVATVAAVFLGLPRKIALACGAEGSALKWIAEAPTYLCRIQPSATLAFLAVLLLTPVVGRFFCECLCPLGVLQSFANWLFHPRSHVRRVCTRLPQNGAQFAIRISVLAAFAALLASGLGAIAWFMTPYSIFGKAMVLFAPGVALFAVIMVLAAFGKGRTWCNWICPAGTLFYFLSKKSVCAHKVAKGCAYCRACFPAKAQTAAKTGEEAEAEAGAESPDAVTRRTALKGVAVLAAADLAEKTTDGGFAEVSLPGVPKREGTVLPPGAVDRKEFNLKCVGCGLCIATCPSKCLRPSVSFATFGQPEMSFQNGYCRMACPQKCAAACPAGALAVSPAARRDIHMGYAVWHSENCIRKKDGVECSACRRKCPVNAIHLVGDTLVVDKDACIGCGACEHVCPARPEPAMQVAPLARQRVVVPVGEDDLVAEMARLVRSGVSCVAAKDGVISAKETGKGVLPVLKLSRAFPLKGAIVVDKVVGRAAAAVCIAGGARRVHAILMSEEARALLEKNGVKATADKFVPRILNRDMSGGCPMDALVEGAENPEDMAKTLAKRLMPE